MTGRRSNQLSYYPEQREFEINKNYPAQVKEQGFFWTGFFISWFINLGETNSLDKQVRMNPLCCRKLELGPISTNAFLLWEENGSEAVLIDCPPLGGSEITDLLSKNNLQLKEIWFTHGHWDHIAGTREIFTSEIKLLGHQADQVLFETPELMSSFSLPDLILEPVHITDWIQDESTLSLWGREVSILHCPGHCPGNVAFYLESENICFVGDVIFAGSVGRTDLPGGNFDDLTHSIRNKIYTLPDETELAVGHGPNTTVGKEKFSNPYVRA